MRTSFTNSPQAVSAQAFGCSVSDCEQARTPEVGSANRLNANFLYQAATIAAAILVLMSI